jgi:hypothetical protein
MLPNPCLRAYTTLPHAVAEMALGRLATLWSEPAARTGLLDQRRALLDAWARHCELRAGDNVVKLNSWKA